jgi:hypothetical protein
MTFTVDIIRCAQCGERIEDNKRVDLYFPPTHYVLHTRCLFTLRERLSQWFRRLLGRP